MKLAKGDMFEYLVYEIVLVTTNSYTTKNGRLVMGRGAARQLRDLIPGIDKVAGRLIDNRTDDYPYGVLLLPGNWGMFQVKDHFKNKASLSLIEFSTDMLLGMTKDLPWARWYLNFPGIGNGGLKREDVLPIIQKLPDSVTVWEL